MGDGAAVPLDDVACAVVERLLQLDERFLRIDLVVERKELDLFAVDAPGGVDRVDVELMRLLRQNAGACGAAGERIDKGNLDIGCRRPDEKHPGKGQPYVTTRASAHISSLVLRFATCKPGGHRGRG